AGRANGEFSSWGGRKGTRNPDILLVRQALYQLSYAPSPAQRTGHRLRERRVARRMAGVVEAEGRQRCREHLVRRAVAADRHPWLLPLRRAQARPTVCVA